MQRLAAYQSGVSGTGTYCLLTAGPTPTGTPGQRTAGSMLVTVTFQVVAGSGVTAGTVQPMVIGADGTARAYGASITLTAPGSNFVSLQTPVLGAALQVLVALTGGTAYLEVDAVLV